MSQALREAAAPEVTEAPPQIYSLMSKVMADIGFIAKGRKNVQQNYAFRGIDDVFSSLQPALIKHGVFFVPEVLKSEQVERATKSGGVLIYTTLVVSYTFYAPDGSSIPATVVGEAMDSGDKSSNKAMSAALKYAVLQIFCVPTEANEDADLTSPDPAPKAARKAVETSAPREAPKPRPASSGGPLATEPQNRAIANLTKSLNMATSELMPILNEAGCVNMPELTKSQASDVITALQELIRKDQDSIF